ncbi:MAG: hypothetical protein JSR48_13860, partial [Verrucomicrobia bacterium]|nr:hypothetical protein [Verrucomicrobiota bacterium]
MSGRGTGRWPARTALATAIVLLAVAGGRAQVPPAPGERETPADEPRAHQRPDRTPSAKSPTEENPDPGVALPPPATTPAPAKLRTERRT